MELVKIAASRREGSGKGEARRLRASGKVPAVAYGKELAPEALSVAPADVAVVLRSTLGANTPLELQVEGAGTRTVMLSEHQVHPLTRVLLHVDFKQIHLDRPVVVQVPLELVGKCVGVVKGGVLRQVFRKLPVSCLPADIPAKLVHDVTNLDLEDHVSPSQLTLPAGVTVMLPANQTVAAVVSERASKAEEEAAAAAPAAGAPAAAPAAGAKPGAPAAGAKAPAAPAKPAGKK